MLMYMRSNTDSDFTNPLTSSPWSNFFGGFDIHKIRKEGVGLIEEIPDDANTPDRYDIEEGDTVRVPKDYQDKFGWNGTVEKIVSIFSVVSSNSNGVEYLFALDELEKLSDVETDTDESSDFMEMFDANDEVMIKIPVGLTKAYKIQKAAFLNDFEWRTPPRLGGPDDPQAFRNDLNEDPDSQYYYLDLDGRTMMIVGRGEEALPRYYYNDLEKAGVLEDLSDSIEIPKPKFSEEDIVQVINPKSEYYLNTGTVESVSDQGNYSFHVNLDGTVRNEHFGGDELSFVGENEKEEQTEKSENKPTFSVGETVRVINPSSKNYLSAGEVGEVKSVSRYKTEGVGVDIGQIGGLCWFKEEELELFEKDFDGEVEGFEVGDKVKIIDRFEEELKGEVVDLYPESEYPIQVDPGVFVTAGYKPSELEKVEKNESNPENDGDPHRLLFDVGDWRESDQNSVDHTPEISEGSEVEVVDYRSDFEGLKGEVKHIDNDRYFEFGVELTFDSTQPIERRVVSFRGNEIELVEEKEYNEVFVYTENYNQLKAYIDVGKEVGYRLPDNIKVDENLSHIRFTPNGLIKVSKVSWHPNDKKVYENIGLSKLRELLKNE